jgi:hypothetical protein
MLKAREMFPYDAPVDAPDAYRPQSWRRLNLASCDWSPASSLTAFYSAAKKYSILFLHEHISNFRNYPKFLKIFRRFINKMPLKSLSKIQKKLSKKRGKLNALHEESRNAKILRRASAREDRIARVATSAVIARQSFCKYATVTSELWSADLTGNSGPSFVLSGMFGGTLRADCHD